MRKILEIILDHREIWDQGYENSYIRKLAGKMKSKQEEGITNFHERRKLVPDEQLREKEGEILLLDPSALNKKRKKGKDA